MKREQPISPENDNPPFAMNENDREIENNEKGKLTSTIAPAASVRVGEISSKSRLLNKFISSSNQSEITIEPIGSHAKTRKISKQ